MLDGVRNNLLRGWPLIIIISVCALPFVFLGTGSLGTIFGSNYGSVNGEQVEEIDIQVAQNRVIQNYRDIFGDDFDFGIEKVGTSVQIVDFNNLPNGLLGITVKAESKVSLNNIIQLEDKSYLGEVLPLTEPEVDDQSLLAKYPDLIEVLVKLKEHPEIKTLQLDIDLDSADSVSYHLGNLIPLTADAKQTLLTAFDADQRFKILSKILESIRKT